jgi:hypothetical protein
MTLHAHRLPDPSLSGECRSADMARPSLGWLRGEDRPRARNALEFMFAAWIELQA